MGQGSSQEGSSGSGGGVVLGGGGGGAAGVGGEVSSIQESGVYDDASAEKLRRFLSETGRYYVVQKPSGGKAHVIGVVPGSRLSAEEAAHLIRAVRPARVYVDVATYDVESIRASMASEKAVAWRAKESPPVWTLNWESGSLSFVINVDTTMRELWRMVGVDLTGPWRAALASAEAVGAEVVSFPVRLSDAFESPDVAQIRAGGMSASAAGNNSVFSDGIQFVMSVGPTSVAALQKYVALPPQGRFTTADLAAVQKDFRATLHDWTRKATVEKFDALKLMDQEGEVAAATAAGGPAGAGGAGGAGAEAASAAQTHIAILANQRELLLAQSTVAAWQLQQGQGDTVGVVDIARAGTILRSWEVAAPPEEVLRPRSWAGASLTFGVPGVVASALGYGYYRFGRRFPRTAVAGLVVLGTLSAFSVVSFRNQAGAQLGTGMWYALARPVPLIGSNLTK
jgi:hypothetical protein